MQATFCNDCCCPAKSSPVDHALSTLAALQTAAEARSTVCTGAVEAHEMHVRSHGWLVYGKKGMKTREPSLDLFGGLLGMLGFLVLRFQQLLQLLIGQVWP